MGFRRTGGGVVTGCSHRRDVIECGINLKSALFVTGRPSSKVGKREKETVEHLPLARSYGGVRPGKTFSEPKHR